MQRNRSWIHKAKRVEEVGEINVVADTLRRVSCDSLEVQPPKLTPIRCRPEHNVVRD